MSTKHYYYIFAGVVGCCVLAIAGWRIHKASVSRHAFDDSPDTAVVEPQTAARILDHGHRSFTLTYREPVNSVTLHAIENTLGVVSAVEDAPHGRSYEILGLRALEYSTAEIAANLIEAGLLERQPDQTTSTGPCSPNIYRNSGSVALSLDCGTPEGRP